jgi:hypothetical protein
MSEIGHTTDGIGTIAWRSIPLFEREDIHAANIPADADLYTL